jgi:hypothetical protein
MTRTKEYYKSHTSGDVTKILVREEVSTSVNKNSPLGTNNSSNNSINQLGSFESIFKESLALFTNPPSLKI